MRRLRNLLRQPEFHTLLFFLGFALLNWPLLGMFRFRPPEAFLAYVYIFWAFAILLLFLLNRTGRSKPATGDDDKPRKEHCA